MTVSAETQVLDNNIGFEVRSFELARKITDELLRGDLLGRNIARNVLTDLATSKRDIDVAWRESLAPDQIQDAAAAKSFRSAFVITESDWRKHG